MIKKFLSLALLLCSPLFAQLNLLPYKTTISALDKNSIQVPLADDIPIGSSGVIIHTFKEGHETIIASVEVIGKKSTGLLLKRLPFNGIPQKALPDYTIAPKVGDKVILNFLYGHALAITPDEATYKTVTQSYDNILWLHPDIFASTLAKSYNPRPDKKDFQEMCVRQDIGLILFAVEDKGYFVDCKSFKHLETIALPASKNAKSPFYHRLQEDIRGRFFGLLGGKSVKNYNSYYKKLLK